MSVTICIPTYNRNEALATLIRALVGQPIPPGLDPACILVIDNNPDGCAKGVVEALGALAGPYSLRHVHEPRPGVSHARNRALDESRESDFVAFIDDDELPGPSWLLALWRVHEATGAAAVFGSVEAAYPPDTPDWMRRGNYHAIPLETDGLRDVPGISGNCLIEMAAINRHAVRFDPRLATVGGEDTLFFDRLLRAGARFANASRAVTHEQVPASRTSLAWLRQRWRRTGLTDALIAAERRGRGPARADAVFQGCIRIAAGGGLAGLAWGLSGGRMTPRVAGFIYTFERGRGMIDYALGRWLEEYARA